ncbi:hypothetical protein GGI21_000829 [Coemansia aciculifera]|uniref:Uncharacterized protein n=1 Tax=Coemansia aciculifera TaxID=417176 RepID=A0ACC1M4P6_9FUNG|nr:hypothetical protein IWW38_002393 [Coemansia aciculifera]KAJ2910477.1 hypothetical protein GGI21_000829 [Coemansia aciculifera]
MSSHRVATPVHSVHSMHSSVHNHQKPPAYPPRPTPIYPAGTPPHPAQPHLVGTFPHTVQPHPAGPPPAMRKKDLKKIRDPRLLEQAEVDKRLKALHRRAKWLDSQFSCCCGLLRFGIESLIGLIPIIGDFAGVFLAVTYMNTVRRRFNVPPGIVSQMTVNIAIDFFVGLVPILGDFIDTLFKANLRNYVLVEKYVHQQRSAAAQGQDLEEGGSGKQEQRPGYFPDLPLRPNVKAAAKTIVMGRR